MNQNASASTQARWSFHLVEEKLELTIDDAAQFIGNLGFDPWVFDEATSSSTRAAQAHFCNEP